MAADRGLERKTRQELGEAGELLLRSPALVKGAELAIRFLLGAALTGGKVLGDASPFGVALVGASGAGTGGLAALLGAALGYVLCRGLETGLRYTAASILVFSVAFAFYDTRLGRRAWTMPILAALINGAAGAVTALPLPWTPSRAAAFAGEMALTALGVYFFHLAFQPWDSPERDEPSPFRRRAGLLFLAVATLVSLADLNILGLLSVGRICAGYGLLAAARLGGPGAGAAAGVTAGLAMDLSAGGLPFYTMAYGFAGLTAGLAKRQKKFTLVLAAFLSTALILLWSWDRGGPAAVLYESGAAALLFLLTPHRILSGLAALLSPPEAPKAPTAEDARARLRGLAGAFADLFHTLKTALRPQEPRQEDPSVIFDRAANRVCVSCPLRDRCWQTDYGDIHSLLSAALPAILEEGRADAAHFPQRFRDRCVRFPPFRAAVEEELAAHLLRRRYQHSLGEERQAVCRRYGDVADLLAETAAAMAPAAVVRPQPETLLAIAGVAGRPKEGQTVSGDAARWFREDGTLTLILCDGMGTGPQARQESDLTLHLLEKFLRAGVRPVLALRTLNEALTLRGESGGGFSTVDLLTLDLRTGRAVLYKLGAAPSYLRRGGCVTRLTGASLPAGLAVDGRRDPDQTAFQMDPGDSLILLTDGVIEEGDDWIRSALSSFDSDSPRALAQSLVDHGSGGDDKTAVVVRIGLKA